MRFREKTTATLLIAIFMISIFAVAYATEGTYLVATGTAGTESTITIDMPAGFTLGQLESISWAVYTVDGYPPHVDIIIDVDEDGEIDNEDVLTAEMHYNNAESPFEVLDLVALVDFNTWRQTFELSDGDGYDKVNDTTKIWLSKMGGGPGDAPSSTLANWKLGVVDDLGGDTLPTIPNASAPVLRLEIEVDNWIIDSHAYVKDIKVNGAAATNLEVEVIPPIAAISVSPSTVDFGTIISGRDSSPQTVTVTNIGSVNVTVTTDIDDTFYQTYLKIDSVSYSGGWDLGEITVETPDFKECVFQLFGVQGVGSHDAVLVFEVTPATP